MHDFGMVGLGTMGHALLLNMAGKGFKVAGYDLDPLKVKALEAEGISGFNEVAAFVQALRPPRPVMLLVPAGAPVDAAIGAMLPYLEEGDFLIDGGNSYFKDTDRRNRELLARGFGFLGLGVSGGESGARRGPAMMAGGTEANYERVREILEAVAAKFEGEPCVARVGSGAAGHYVKMVHNGIEYGMMQLIAETYDLMRRGLGMASEAIAEKFSSWNDGPLGGYLLEITAQILRFRDNEGVLLVEAVSDKAKAKGTGKWTSQDALDLGVPVPTIDAAVSARILSAYKSERLAASASVPLRNDEERPNLESVLEPLGDALRIAILATYAQGMHQISAASKEYGFGTDIEMVSRIWRAGCIVRSKMLGAIRDAYRRDPGLSNLLLDPEASDLVKQGDGSLRKIVGVFAANRIPSPCFSASLAYLDGYRSVRLPANLIQAQRDLFGAHTFERLDREGSFHSDWELES